jgi:hypothetical protein
MATAVDVMAPRTTPSFGRNIRSGALAVGAEEIDRGRSCVSVCPMSSISATLGIGTRMVRPGD